MRRMIITAVASAALAVPGIALASHQGEQQQRDDHGVHHARHHARHHHHAHLVTFGASASSAPAGGSGTTTPTAPVPTSDESAGTIASFSNGLLTIALKDGSTVSGEVTSFTEIECRSAMAAAASHGDQGDQNDQGDDRGRDGQSNSGPSNGGQNDGQAHDEGDDNGQDVGDDNGQDEAEHCTTAALVQGTVVREAELSVSSAGSVWRKVELNQ
jgi:hypothetical protein